MNGCGTKCLAGKPAHLLFLINHSIESQLSAILRRKGVLEPKHKHAKAGMSPAVLNNFMLMGARLKQVPVTLQREQMHLFVTFSCMWPNKDEYKHNLTQ